MDLEYLLRACWRRKYRILAFMVIFALILGVGVSKIKPLKYAATTTIVAYPDGQSPAEIGAYALDPSVYVSDQVQAVDSNQSIVEVASQLRLPPSVVTKMISVKVIPKTDDLAVKATSASPTLSQRVSTLLSQNYVEFITKFTSDNAQKTVTGLNSAVTALEDEINHTKAQLASTNDAATSTSLQNALNTYATQLTQLNASLASAQANTGQVETSIVSSSNSVVGDSKKKLLIYGLLLGMVIGVAQVAITAGPGRSLENLGAVSEVDGVPVVGVMRSRPSGRSRFLSHLPGVRHLGSQFGRTSPSASELRIAQEIAFTLRMKGQTAFIPLGSPNIDSKAANALRHLLAKKRIGPTVISTGDHASPDVVIAPLTTMVAEDAPEGLLPSYLGVEVAKVRPKELTDVIATLRSTGAEILGIVGLQ
jgi:hypothetical protein